MFSAILGLGASLIGASQANKQAKAADKQYKQQLAFQKEQMAMFQELAQQAQSQQSERNDQLLAWEQWMQSQAADERQYSIDAANQYADQRMAEYQQQIARQVQADQEAARMRAYDLQRIAENQDISAQERAYAEQQLAYAQQVASDEHAEELQRYYENQARATAQREYMMGVANLGQQYAAEDQARDLAVRDRVTGQIDNLQATLQAAYDSMGDAPTIERLTRGDIDREISRRTNQYMSDVDRAADRVASINEAGLMRTGMDRSTTGTTKRAEIAGRLADEYQTARNRAYDDALAYITGQSDALTQNVNNIMGQRSATLAEIGGVASTGLAELNNLPNVSSQLAGLQLSQLVGDGIYNGSVASANNYSAPVAMGSSIYDGITPSQGMSNYQIGTSGAVNVADGVLSAITNPANLALENPASYFNASTSISGNLLNGAQTNNTNAQNKAANASSGFGQDFTSFLNDYGDQIWSNIQNGSLFGSGA